MEDFDKNLYTDDLPEQKPLKFNIETGSAYVQDDTPEYYDSINSTIKYAKPLNIFNAKRRAADAVYYGNYQDFINSFGGSKKWAAKRATRLANRFQKAKEFGDYRDKIMNASPEELRNFTPEQFGERVAFGRDDVTKHQLIPGAMSIAGTLMAPEGIIASGVAPFILGAIGGAAGGKVGGAIGNKIDERNHGMTSYGSNLAIAGGLIGGAAGGGAGAYVNSRRLWNGAIHKIKNGIRAAKDLKYMKSNPGSISIDEPLVIPANENVVRTPGGHGVINRNHEDYYYDNFLGNTDYTLEGPLKPITSYSNGQMEYKISGDEFVVKHPKSGGFVYKNTAPKSNNHHGADVVMSQNTRTQLDTGRPVAEAITTKGNYQGADNAVSPFGRQARMAYRESKRTGKSMIRELRRINRSEKQLQKQLAGNSYCAYNNFRGMGYGPGAYISNIRHALKDNRYALRYGRQVDKFLKVNRGDPRYNYLLDLQERALTVDAPLSAKQEFVDALNNTIETLASQYPRRRGLRGWIDRPDKAWIGTNGDLNIPHPVQLKVE